MHQHLFTAGNTNKICLLSNLCKAIGSSWTNPEKKKNGEVYNTFPPILYHYQGLLEIKKTFREKKRTPKKLARYKLFGKLTDLEIWIRFFLQKYLTFVLFLKVNKSTTIKL